MKAENPRKTARGWIHQVSGRDVAPNRPCTSGTSICGIRRQVYRTQFVDAARGCRIERMSGLMTETIGTVAGILTTVSFAPQAIRTWRTGGEGLSWSMLVLFGTGVGLWFVYGVLRHSNPIMLANGLTELQVLFIFAVKISRA
jgi:MtN3 and saliva related transmembrane protein